MTCNPERVRCLFGTDGVRDVANRGDMTPEMALRLGRSYILFLTERGVPPAPHSRRKRHEEIGTDAGSGPCRRYDLRRGGSVPARSDTHTRRQLCRQKNGNARRCGDQRVPQSGGRTTESSFSTARATSFPMKWRPP
jgi:Phosphomannomutase